MKTPAFFTAIEIISHHHSNTIVINKVKENGQCPDFTAPTLHVLNCVPAVVENLVKAGYMVAMRDGFLEVTMAGQN